MEEVYYWECAVPLEYGERGVGGRKPTRPSLPLRKAPPFSPSLSSIVFTTPSVPLLGDRNPQGREDVTALRCSEPLRSKVGGASKPSPCCAGWDRQAVAGGDLMLHQSPRHVVRDGTAWG